MTVTTPINKLAHASPTKAVLGTEKRKLDGYISGMAETLKGYKFLKSQVNLLRDAKKSAHSPKKRHQENKTTNACRSNVFPLTKSEKYEDYQETGNQIVHLYTEN
jgi:hypothetical protein